MRKRYAFLLLSILLVNVFGSIISSGIHEFVHYMDDPDTIVTFQSNKESASDHNAFHGHGIYHDHGHGYHSHDSYVTILLKSFDYKKLSSFLNELKHAFLLMLSLHGALETESSFLGSDFQLDVEKPICCIVRFFRSAYIDIPTPPPRLMFS